MGVQFVRRPADGSLPFINADGHDIAEVFRTLKRFAQIANGGEIADTVRLHPVQVAKVGPITLWDLKPIADLEVLPTEGVLYKGDKPLAIIRNLPLPFTPPETDAAAIEAQHRKEHAQALTDEAKNLRSLAESLDSRAKNLLR